MHPMWEKLEKALTKEPNLDAARATALMISDLYHSGRAVIRYEGEGYYCRTIFAYLACRTSADREWGEISTAYVRKDKRGNGQLRHMLEELIEKEKTPKQLFAISKDPAFIAVACRPEFGFRAVCADFQPLFDLYEWSRRLGIDSRVEGIIGSREFRITDLTEDNQGRGLLIH